MFYSKESKELSDLKATVLAGWLHEIVETSRKSDRDLEMLSVILAVAIKGYTKSLGEEEAAMLFYGVADELAVSNIGNDEGESYDGNKRE